MLLVIHFDFLAQMPAKNWNYRKVVEERRDVLFNLPTGFGKSLLYQEQSLVFHLTSQEPGHIVVVVSLLIMRQPIRTPAPRAPGQRGGFTRPKPGFKALLTARRPRGAVHLTKCL